MAVRPNLKAAVGLILLLLSGTVSAQNFSAGVNTENPNPRAVLHLVSPNGDQGLLIPQLTTAQRTSMGGGLNAQSNGLLVYDNEQGLFYFWLNSGWIALSVTDNQTLAVSGTNLTIQNGNSVDLAATGFLLSETDPTVPDAIKDGIDWTELTNIPAGFADGVDEVGSSAGDGATILGDGNTTPFSVGVIDIAQVTGLAAIAASGSFNDLADVPATLDVDNTDDVSTSAVPAPGDVSGSFALGLVVDQVGGEAAADVGAATFFVINNPSIDPDFSDDLTLSDTPAGGDVSGDFGTGLIVDFVGTETASDVAAVTALVIANPTLDLDASDDFDGAYGSLTGVSVVNADVNAAAAIAGTKINPNFGTQAITTTGAVTGASFSGDGSGLTNVTATNFTGTLVGDVTGTQGATVIANDAVNSTKILDGTIANIDVSGTAAIAGTKIAPNFGTQAITTTGAVTGASFSGDGSGLTNVTATNFTGALVGDVTGTQGATIISNVNPAAIAAGGAVLGDILEYDGSNWVPGVQSPFTNTDGITLTGDGTPGTELALLSVPLPTIDNGGAVLGDILEFDGANWVPATNTAGPLNDAFIFVGNGSNVPVGVAVSGDLTLSNTGVATIAANAVDNTKIAATTITNNEISGTAAIAGTKINPDFGTQNIITSGNIQLNAGGGNVSIAADPLTVTHSLVLPPDNLAGVLTNDGAGTLTWNPAGAGNYIIDANENQKGGASAAAAITTGVQNLVLGNLSGSGLTVGNGNVVAGHSGGLSLVGGSDNLVIGRLADASGDGSNNVVLGDNADAATGSNSVAIGASASVDGNQSVALGQNSSVTGGAVRAVAIGSGTAASQNNTVVMGQGPTVVYNVGVGTATPAARLEVTTHVGEPSPGIRLNHQAASGSGLRLDMSDATNTANGLEVNNGSAGIAASFSNNNVGSTANTMIARNVGVGTAGEFEINNATNGVAAVFSHTNGLGSAGIFDVTNGSSSSAALVATTSGTGAGIRAFKPAAAIGTVVDVAHDAATGNGILVNMNSNSTDAGLRIINTTPGANSVEADGNINTASNLTVGSDAIINGRVITPPQPQAAVAALPLPTSRIVRLTGGGTINSIAVGQDGQEIILINADVPDVTINDGATISLDNNNPFVMATSSTLHLVYDVGLATWLEIGRSANN